jgi:hypothetical protein
MFRTILIATTLSAFTANAPETAPAKPERAGLEPEVADISGYYTCKGVESGGKAYTGVAVITKKSDVYLIQWMIGSGSTFTGIGIRQGNTLSASWAMPGERGLVRGINTYKIETGPRLSGRWATLPGNGSIQTENMTFLKSIEPEED